MQAIQTQIPSNTRVESYLPADYTDTFVITIPAEDNSITSTDLQVNLWTQKPKWLEALFKLRNILVKPFGLETEERDQKQFIKCLREGGAYGMNSVPLSSPQETILRMDDKHLEAIISIYLTDCENKKRNVYAITLVKYHNRLGRVYFFLIRPFHKIVVKEMMKYILKR